jgi:formylglycine-generating enzyme
LELGITVTAQNGATNVYTLKVDKAGDHSSANIGALKYVPRGTFQRDDTATNTSAVSSFRMSANEITAEQFVAITGLSNPSGSFIGVTNGPVQMVTWYQAVYFCNKLSVLEGLNPVYTIKGRADPSAWGGLPTEMEWMWAAMGSTSGFGYVGPVYTSGYSKLFAGSVGINSIGDYAWYMDNGGSNTHRVGSTASPNELGLYDMSGNVYEFCWDLYDGNAYQTGALTDYRGPSSGYKRVARGGSWGSSASILKLSWRDKLSWYGSDSEYGFRVARSRPLPWAT